MSDGKVILSESDFTEVIDAAGVISSVPKAWVDTKLLPAGTKKATAANVKAAQAKAGADKGEKVDVDQIRADIEAGLREEHEAALAERDARIAELEEQVASVPEQPADAKGDAKA